MNWAGAGIAAIALLSALASGQTQPDFSQDARLQQKVDVHFKRALLPDVLHALKIQTNLKFLVGSGLDRWMVCVYAKDQPVWLVMKDIADLFGARWKDLKSEWRLDELKDTSRKLLDYEALEQGVLESDIRERAMALADIASTRSWAQASAGPKDEESSGDDEESPEKWAAKKARDPAYYVAGLMFSRVNLFNGNADKFDCGGGFIENHDPVGYRLVPPPNEAVAKSHQCGPEGDLAVGLDGTQILIRPTVWAGTLQSAVVAPASRKPAKPPHLVRYPRPTEELAKTVQGKWLLDWETSLEDDSQDVLLRSVGGFPLPPSPYIGGACGIEDQLEAFADALHVPVVSDGFRMPLIGRGALPGGTVREWLQSLKRVQGCFVRVQDGSIIVRHGGFWDLRRWEPPEATLRHFEAIGQLGLDDYADLAYELCNAADLSRDSCLLPFFESKEVPLTLFDPRPMVDGYVALAAFGQMTEKQRKHILSGGYINCYRSVVDDTRLVPNTLQLYDARRKKWLLAQQAPTVAKSHEGWDAYVNWSALTGVFFGGTPVGLEIRLLETGAFPSTYLWLWGDNVDTQARATADGDDDPIGIFHAHRLSIMGLPTDPAFTADRPERHVVGTIRFLSAVRSADGLITEVKIPDARGM